MVMAPSMPMEKRLSGYNISNDLIAIMMANLIEMKDGRRADSLITLKIGGTTGKINSIAGKIDGTAARINGIAGKIDGIVKKMFANLKEIGGSIEGMCRAMQEEADAAKASPFALSSHPHRDKKSRLARSRLDH